MFLCATDTIGIGATSEATPTTAVAQKNPDRSISSDRRAIADLRRVNVRFDTMQYYPAAAPSIYDITRRTMSLVGMYPGLSLRVTIRDVASAFRLLRLHPALSLVMVTESPADNAHLTSDLVFCYLVMPFGWTGSPAHFARFGDAVPRLADVMD